MNRMPHKLLLGALAAVACTPRATQGPAANSSPGAVPTGDGAAMAAPATNAPADTRPNPFEGADMYVSPDYKKKLEAAAKAAPALAASITKLESVPTAIWLDSIASVSRIGPVLDQADQQAAASNRPVVTVFVVYDLPNRDCSAKASAGELQVAAGGEQRYKSEFVDKIAEAVSAHPKARVVAIIEPDSLANLATNLNVPKCKASDESYRNDVAYAVSKLALPNVWTYLDAAHAGWLGWGGNSHQIVAIYKDVLTRAGGAQKIRGFATNVSNYNTLSGGDGKILGPQNPCPDELSYISKLDSELTAAGITGKHFIIDTARNGRVVRKSWGNWCNIKGAGLGERPVASPKPLVDAYYWVKPPGESDGTSDEKAARFDANCKSEDALPNAPEAGQWFQQQFIELVKNANPPL